MLQNILKNNPEITGVCHVGANRGQEYKCYKKFGLNIVFFEPLPDVFAVLEKSCPDATNINKALGPNEAIVMMHVASNDGQSSSILKPSGCLRVFPGIKFEKRIMVQQDTLDNYEAEILRQKTNLLVLDVQGYELEVLKGAKNTLKYFKFILSEINTIPLYVGSPVSEDIDKFLGNYRMTSKEMDDDSDGIWGNALYIKKTTLL